MIHHSIKPTKAAIGVGITSANTAILVVSCHIMVCTNTGATFGGIHHGTTTSAWSYMLTPYTCVHQVVSMALPRLTGCTGVILFRVNYYAPTPPVRFGHLMTCYVHINHAAECEYRRSSNAPFVHTS